MPHNLPPARKRRVRAADGGKLRNQSEQGVAFVEIALRRGCIGADQVIIVVAGRAGGEHVFARGLIVTIADEALFVSVIDYRAAPQGQQHRMRKLYPREQFLLPDFGPIRLHEGRETAHVMIAEEGR